MELIRISSYQALKLLRLKMGLRIVHASHSFYPAIGGMETAIKCLAEEQVKMGHEVHVVTSLIQGKARNEVINGVQIHRVKTIRFHYPDLTLPREIPREILKKADIVHVHSQNSLFSVKMLEESDKLAVKTACYFVAVDAFNKSPNLLIRLLAPYYGRMNTLKALRMSDLLLVKSIRDLKILREKYGVEATYLPDGVPDYYFTVKKDTSDVFRRRFGIRQQNFFLYIGRMHRLKGPHILVKALKYVSENVAAVFIGPDGGYLSETLSLAERIGVKDRVYVLGYVDEETKIQAIDSATALVLPSITEYVEVYPMVISEAWTREKPVIASSVGGIPYRIKHGINGILVAPSDYRMLANAMLELIDNNKLAEEMGRNGRKEVLSWREVTLKSIELYR